MIWRALMVWVGILILAVLNGGARLAWLIPYFSETAGRALSTIALCGLVFVVAWLTISWMRPLGVADALRLGLLWLLLTLAFEFLAGHYLFHQPWAVLLKDYDLSRGRISGVAVLVVVLFAPLWSMRLRTIKPG